MPSDLPPWMNKALQPFRTSPQKAWVLLGLAVLLAVMWGRMLLGAHGPNGAAAMAPPPSLADPLAAMHRPPPAVNPLQKWAHQPIVPLDRNLFNVPLDYYPQDASEDRKSASELAKSHSTQADLEQQRQILVDNIRQRAQALKLESTMTGSQPSAIVNGEVVREGSVVEGFRVLRIEARRIVVECQGVSLELSMQQ